VELLELEAATILHIGQRSKISGALYPLSLHAFTELCLVSVALPSYFKTSITDLYISLTAIFEYIAGFQLEKCPFL
jgi:hypothetical protein